MAIRKTFWLLFFVSSTILLGGCASGYSQFYQPASGLDLERIYSSRATAAPAQPVVERGSAGDPDQVLAAYAKRGYLMIGSSTFTSGRKETDESAIQQGKSVGADIVLILNPSYAGSVTSSLPITTPTTSTTYSNATATAYGVGGPVSVFGSGTTTTFGTSTNYIPVTTHRSNFGALYFVKQKFALGAFFRDLNDLERQSLQTNRGAVVRLVVDGSPAFNADLLIGDIFLYIDGLMITNSESIGQVLNDRKGNNILISIIRNGQKIEKQVRLNAP